MLIVYRGLIRILGKEIDTTYEAEQLSEFKIYYYKTIRRQKGSCRKYIEDLDTQLPINAYKLQAISIFI